MLPDTLQQNNFHNWILCKMGLAVSPIPFTLISYSKKSIHFTSRCCNPAVYTISFVI